MAGYTTTNAGYDERNVNHPSIISHHQTHGGHHTHQTQQNGQCVKAEVPSERSLASSVAELMTVQTSHGQKTESCEKVEWVSFLDGDLNEPWIISNLKGVVGSEPPILVGVGLARGYQIWALMKNGDCEELISDRKGPIKTLKLLPHPLSLGDPGSQKSSNTKSRSDRPYVGIVDSISAVAGRLHSSLSIASLATGHTVDSIVCDDPICSFTASRKYLAVNFPGKIEIYDAVTFKPTFILCGLYRPDEIGAGTPFDLGMSSWIAYADSKLSTVNQSCGGVGECTGEQGMPAYAAHVMNAAKNIRQTVSSIGESVLGGGGHHHHHHSSGFGGGSSSPMVHGGGGSSGSGIHSSSGGGSSLLSAGCIGSPAILTVINCDAWPGNDQVDIHSMPNSLEETGHIIAHFPAFKDEPVSWIKFSPNSILLAVSGLSGQCVHLFHLLPHPVTPAMSGVNHLYTLFRGSTPARVLNGWFSRDSRWLAITTNHGTTHVFPISPYGGSITVRTHAGRGLVNRDSRYYQSAGLELLNSAAASPPKSAAAFGISSVSASSSPSSPALTPGGSLKGSPLSRDIHPSVHSSNLSWAGGNPAAIGGGSSSVGAAASMMRSSTGNPRVPPFPAPVVVHAAGKIHGSQLIGSVASWAPDLSGVGGGGSSSSKKRSSFGGAADLCGIGGTGYGGGIGGGGNCPASLAVAIANTRSPLTAIVNHKDSHNSGGNNSVFVMNDSGELTEYKMDVRPAAVGGGVDRTKDLMNKDVELSLTATAQWVLQRTKSSPDLRAPLAKSNPLRVASDTIIQKHNMVHQPPQKRLNSGGGGNPVEGRENVKPPLSFKQDPNAWISQVEIQTYCGPSRRLWSGPQFTFKTYAPTSTTKPQQQQQSTTGTGAAAAALSSSTVSSSTPNTPPNPGKKNNKKGKNGKNGGNHQQQQQSERSQPIPVANVRKNSSGTTEGGMIVDMPNSYDPSVGVTIEVCGSWSDTDHISNCDKDVDNRVRESIAEAMKDEPKPKKMQPPPVRHPPVARQTHPKHSASSKTQPARIPPQTAHSGSSKHSTKSFASHAGGRPNSTTKFTSDDDDLLMEDARSSFSNEEEEEDEDALINFSD